GWREAGQLDVAARGSARLDQRRAHRGDRLVAGQLAAGPVEHRAVGRRGWSPVDAELTGNGGELWRLDDDVAPERRPRAEDSRGVRSGIVEQIRQPDRG